MQPPHDPGDRVSPLEESPTIAPGAHAAAASASPPEAPGEDGLPALTRVGHYRMIRSLGRGAQGQVYLAEDTRLERKVALKVLGAAYAGSRAMLARFRREAAVASRLDHPSICSVYEAGEADGMPYIAMRYVEGESLAQRIAASKARVAAGTSAAAASGGGENPSSGLPSTREDVRRVTGLIEKAARGLHAAHESGLIHRDIKPGNIMVTPSGDPVILDFGLARDEDDKEQSLTHSGDLLGTPAYMSPEQLLAQRITLDRRTDIYSLGVTLFECLTLRRPFDAPTRDGLYQQILAGNPPDPSKLNAQVSRDLKVILETALEKDRGRRYKTALDFAEDLRRFRGFEPILARPAGPALRFQRWVQRNPVIATATLSAFVILVTVVVILVTLLRSVGKERDAKEQALAEVEKERDEKTRALGEREALLSEREQTLRVIQRERDEKSGLYLTAQAASVLPDNPGLALLLALEGTRRHASPLTTNLLLEILRGLREERTLLDHRGSVTAASYSRDGKLALTASADGSARVWELDGGTTRALFTRHAAPIRFAGFSDDGEAALSASEDGVIWTWATASGSPRASFLGHTDGPLPSAAAFSPDRARVASAGADSKTFIWDATTGKPTAPPLAGDECGIHQVVFSADGKRLLTASDGWIHTYYRSPDGSTRSMSLRPKLGETAARLWDAADGRLLATFGAHVGKVFAAFNANGKVVTASRNGLRVWSAEDGGAVAEAAPRQEGNLLRSIVGVIAAPYDAACFSADGRVAGISTAAGAFHLFDAADGSRLAEFQVEKAGLVAMSLSDDGQRLATIGSEAKNVARVWDARSGEALFALKGHTDAITTAAFSPDRTRMITASRDGTARLWRIETRDRLVRSVEVAAIQDRPAELSSDGGRVLVGGDRVIEVPGGRSVQLVRPRSGIGLFQSIPVEYAGFLDGGRLAVTASHEGHLYIWNAATGDLVSSGLLSGRLLGGSVSPDGRCTLDLSMSRPLLRELADEGRVRSLEAGAARLETAVFSPDSRTLLAYSQDRRFCLFDVESGRRLSDWPVEDRGRTGPGNLVMAISSPGARALIGGDAGAAIVRTAGGPPMVLDAPSGVSAACFDPGGQRLLTVSGSGEARLWDAQSGQAAVRLAGGGVLGAAFSPDGARVLAIRDDNSAGIFDLSSDGAHPVALVGHQDLITAADFDPSGERVVTASLDGTARIWMSRSGQLARSFGEHRGALSSAEFSADGRRVITAGAGGDARIWDAADGTVLQTLRIREFGFSRQSQQTVGPAPAGSWAAAGATPAARMPSFSRDGRRVLVADAYGPAVFDAETGALLSRLEDSTERRVAAAAIHPAGDRFLVVWDALAHPNPICRSLRLQSTAAFAQLGRPLAEIRDAASGGLLAARAALERPAELAVFSADGRLAAIQLRDGGAVILDVASGGAAARLAFTGDAVRLEFSADNRLMLILQRYRPLNVYDLAEGRTVISLMPENGEFSDARFSPDGKRLAVAGTDHAVRLWDVEKNAMLSLVRGPIQEIHSLGFSQDGRWLAVLSNALALILDVDSGREALRLPSSGGIRDLRFSSDVQHAAVLRDDGIDVWPLDVRARAELETPRRLSPEEMARFEIGTADEQIAYRWRWDLESLRRDLEVVRRQKLDENYVRGDARAMLASWIGQLAGRSPDALTRAAVEGVRTLIGEAGDASVALLEPLAELQALDGDVNGAILSLEEAAERAGAGPALADKLQALRKAAWPELVSYASIDAAIESGIPLVAPDAEWRFFRGRSAPAEGADWTALDFDDSGWETGKAPIGFGDGDDGTVLEDMRGSYTSIYMRRVFEVPAPGDYGEVILRALLDDGMVAYLNGVEIGRAGAPASGAPLRHDAIAAATVQNAARLSISVPAERLQRGRNILAVHGLNADIRSSDLTIGPALAVAPSPRSAAARERFAAFLARTDPALAPRIAYLEGRLLDLAGRRDDAQRRFLDAIAIDPSASEPHLRLAESLRDGGSAAAALARIEEAFAAASFAKKELVELWFQLAIAGGGHAPAAALARLPAGFAARPKSPRAQDLIWLTQELAARRPIRIRCGGGDYVAPSGKAWGRDRFYQGGRGYYESAQGRSTIYPGDISGTEDDGVYQTERWFPAGVGPVVAAYQVPLPPAKYRLTLHFAELIHRSPRLRVFDILVDGREVPELLAVDPPAAGFAAAMQKSVEVEVRDGHLDIALRRKVGDPKLSGIEIEAVETRG
jgi:WD40 repeat protein/serine/threonine protein kinase/tetratricopeptide (TPR) repeat protein